MENISSLQRLCAEIHDELTGNILQYWIDNTLDRRNGGFVGRISVNNNRELEADKSLILHARILWTFSAAFSHFQKDEYLMMAQRAFKYIRDYFFDAKRGGYYWMISSKGRPVMKDKQIYGQAFVIYALAEFFEATKDNDALDEAIAIFNLIEKFSYDTEYNGYFEAFSVNWKATTDTKLIGNDIIATKTMNTHLHLLEAYTRLFHVWQDDLLKKQLTGLVQIHLDKIINPHTGHFHLFFDRKWNVSSDIVSYGHDIEASWLLKLAAQSLNDVDITNAVNSTAAQIAEATLKEGVAKDGSIVYEGNKQGITDTDRHWWPQAEGLVGFLDAYETTEHQQYLNTALSIWAFIKKHIVNPTGEWYWRVDENYNINPADDKVGPWKAPYHNSRACLQLLQRQKC